MSAAEEPFEREVPIGGAPPRHIDATTARLDMLARSWRDVQQTRLALAQRELDDAIVDAFAAAEAKLSAALSKTLRQHALWPWLSEFKGLGGAHTAGLIGRIGDPRRFPGQRCSEGHYLPPLYAVGAPCPIAARPNADESPAGDGALDARADENLHEVEVVSVCPGVMLPPRTTTGVRSIWHWAGLHALEDGTAPRKRKGVRCDWDPRARTHVMQEGGIAEHIVRQNTSVYADKYREAKASLILRVPALTGESDVVPGDANHLRAAETWNATESFGGRPLALHEADRIARKVAAKQFLGDLLTEWKRLCAAETNGASEWATGGAPFDSQEDL